MEIPASKEIVEMILSGAKYEGNSIDWTRGTLNLDSVGEKIAAFATSSGGWLVLGIDDHRKVVGLGTEQETVSRIGAALRSCSPIPSVGDIDFVAIGAKIVAVLRVTSLGGQICTYKSIPYHRVQDSAKKMEMQDVIAALSRCGDISWERRLSAASVQAIDKEELDFYLIKANARTPITQTMRENFLRISKACASDMNALTNLGVIALAEKPAAYIPQSKIQLVRFRGIEPGARIASYLCELPAHKMIETCFSFIKLNLPVREKYEGTARTEEPIIPEKVIREALVNIVVHRDYDDTQESLIRIFDDRIEFQNPGAPAAAEMAKILSHSIPFHRNPDLYNFLRPAHQAEGAGQGIPIMKRELSAIGLDAPRITTLYTIFHLSISFQKRKPASTEEAVFLYCLEHKNITTNEIIKVFSISRPTAINLLNEFVRQGHAVHLGSRRNSRYIFQP